MSKQDYSHLYGTAWKKLRAAILRQRPLCVECEKIGRIVKATHLDHITPHRGDMALFHDTDNLQGLCHSCHSAKTAAEDGGFGNKAGKAKEKVSRACGIDGLPVDSKHHWTRGRGATP